eukprot:1150973-Pelagomonas_calceolata.AAC.7
MKVLPEEVGALITAEAPVSAHQNEVAWCRRSSQGHEQQGHGSEGMRGGFGCIAMSALAHRISHRLAEQKHCLWFCNPRAPQLCFVTESSVAMQQCKVLIHTLRHNLPSVTASALAIQ